MPPLWLLLLTAVTLFFLVFQEYFFLVARLLENHRELLLEGITSLDLLRQIVQRMIIGMKLHHRWSRCNVIQCDEHLTEQDTLHTTECSSNITTNTNNEIALACPDGPYIYCGYNTRVLSCIFHNCCLSQRSIGSCLTEHRAIDIGMHRW